MAKEAKTHNAAITLPHLPVWRRYGGWLSTQSKVHVREPKDRKVDSIVILLHGLSQNGACIMTKAREPVRELLPGAAIISIDGVYGADPDQHLRARKGRVRDKSFSWFELPGGRFHAKEELRRQIRPSVDRVHSVIDEALERYGLDESSLHIIGFSQGGAIGIQAAIERNKPCAGVANLCGPFFDPDIFDMHEPRSRPPIFYGFDLGDEVTPAGLAYHAMTAMKRLQLPVTMHIIPAGPAEDVLHYDHRGRPYMAPKPQPGTPEILIKRTEYRDEEGKLRLKCTVEKSGHWVSPGMRDALLYTYKHLKDDPNPVMPEMRLTQLSQETTPRITANRLALWWALNPTVLTSRHPAELRPMNAWNRLAYRARKQTTHLFASLARGAIKRLAPLLFDFPEKVDKAFDSSSNKEEVVKTKDLDKLMGRPEKPGIFNP